MRYFIEKFEETHNKENPFGFFPLWEYYRSTGTHIGTDFKVVIGTSIFAPLDGEMFKAEYNQYKGNVGIFIFEHQGTTWGLELCHLKELPTKGKYKEGDVIAYSGNTGGSTTGAYLHAVLHRNAHVTKHYGLLQSREAFLQLQEDGAIVDCFDWFCKNIRETPKPEPQPIINAPKKQESPESIKKGPVKPEVKQTSAPVPAIPQNKGFLLLLLELIKNWGKKN